MRTNIFYFNPEILLISDGPEHGLNQPRFVLKSEFDLRGFIPDQGPEPTQLEAICRAVFIASDRSGRMYFRFSAFLGEPKSQEGGRSSA